MVTPALIPALGLSLPLAMVMPGVATTMAHAGFLITIAVQALSFTGLVQPDGNHEKAARMSLSIE